MSRNLLFTLLASWLMLPRVTMAQDLDAYLRSVVQNNPELAALQAQQQQQRLTYQAENRLPDPQVGAYYLPLGRHDTRDYLEFELTQSFEFPTVYGARRAWIAEQTARLNAGYAQRRQEILLEAALIWLEWAFLIQKQQIAQTRIELARTVFEQTQQKFTTEEVGILAYNRAKLAWLQQRSGLAIITSDIERLRLLLAQLNGGTAPIKPPGSFEGNLLLPSLDSLWAERLAQDPTLTKLRAQEAVAQQQIELRRQQRLPRITLGANYQGVASSYYGGLYGGLSIPLWRGQQQVKLAEAEVLYQESHRSAQEAQQWTILQQQYQQYQTELSTLREYQETLANLNSEALLLKSYQLGQISFLEFYMELQFYHDAFDHMQRMEWSLHQLRIQLLKHQL